MVIILFPILLSALVRNLKYLAPLSLVANAFMITGICTTFYFTTQDIPSPERRDYIASISSIPLYFGTAIFAFEGIGLVSTNSSSFVLTFPGLTHPLTSGSVWCRTSAVSLQATGFLPR